MSDVSVSPSGEAFPLPTPEDYAAELERVEALVGAAKAQGKEVVVVMGVGFVGCEVKTLGRGYIQRLKDEVRKAH
jgi:UDP-N-acetyl-D-glucosamine dehydrogenase